MHLIESSQDIASTKDVQVRKEQPLNAEPTMGALRGEYLTPRRLFFVRNHGSVPHLRARRHRLAVCGEVGEARVLDLAALERQFDAFTVVASLQCAGNRRRELDAIDDIAGVPWDGGAIGTALWTGARLRDVLLAAGCPADGGEDLHVAFESCDRVHEGDRTFAFGGSIPLAKALQPEVLIAYEMNGRSLRPEHGYPLRVVVPGYIGARSVKWLTGISVQRRPSDNHFQQRAYKTFPPEVTEEQAEWKHGRTLGELPVNAVICEPGAGATVGPGAVAIRGYALSGGGRAIARVDVSLDGGASWRRATVVRQSSPWAWAFWELTAELRAGPRCLVVRAWDDDGRTQPAHAAALWNFKGYLDNAWHRVHVFVKG